MSTFTRFSLHSIAESTIMNLNTKVFNICLAVQPWKCTVMKATKLRCSNLLYKQFQTSANIRYVNASNKTPTTNDVYGPVQVCQYSVLCEPLDVSKLCYSRSRVVCQIRKVETKKHSKPVPKKDYKFPEITKKDMDVYISRGGGPGGQAVAKTSNCVRLKHIPTGITVRCHETRSLATNKEIAIQRLREKLDEHINGEESYNVQVRKYHAAKNYRQRTKNEIRREMKMKWKEDMARESLEDKEPMNQSTGEDGKSKA